MSVLLRSGTEVKTPRAMTSRSIFENHGATWLSHDGGIVIQRLDDGAWRFTGRNGESLDACAPGHTSPLADWTNLVVAHRVQGISIDATTAATRWRGERMDYGIANSAPTFQLKRGSPTERVVALALDSGGSP